MIKASDYYLDAFGGFQPHLDVYAAIKFILNSVLMDSNFDTLHRMLSGDNQPGAIEGEPAWILERRCKSLSPVAYADWPESAHFRAFVDPHVYELKHPELFMTQDVFIGYLGSAVKAYLQRNPEEADEPAVKAVAALAQVK